MGWGVLCIGGMPSYIKREGKETNIETAGGAYYFAKKSINNDRQSRFENELKRKAKLAAQESEYRRFSSPRDDTHSPSTEAQRDPAATRHEPSSEAERVLEKGKYEAAEPFRPPKGNRFS